MYDVPASGHLSKLFQSISPVIERPVAIIAGQIIPLRTNVSPLPLLDETHCCIHSATGCFFREIMKAANPSSPTIMNAVVISSANSMLVFFGDGGGIGLGGL